MHFEHTAAIWDEFPDLVVGVPAVDDITAEVDVDGQGELPRVHPVADLCDAVSSASAIPVAVVDLAGVSGDLKVRPAVGDETRLTFGGDTANREPREVVFADRAGQAPASRRVDRQSGRSAVRATTSSVLNISESTHTTATDDTGHPPTALSEEPGAVWSTEPDTAILSTAPRFEVRP